jgi:DNA polymerase-3 subunit epsilon
MNADNSLKLRKPLAVIDLETTGINVARDRIVELCAVVSLTVPLI